MVWQYIPKMSNEQKSDDDHGPMWPEHYRVTFSKVQLKSAFSRVPWNAWWNQPDTRMWEGLGFYEEEGQAIAACKKHSLTWIPYPSQVKSTVVMP
jgi:hypothetical protein